jgi:hypothetical protein
MTEWPKYYISVKPFQKGQMAIMSGIAVTLNSYFLINWLQRRTQSTKVALRISFKLCKKWDLRHIFMFAIISFCCFAILTTNIQHTICIEFKTRILGHV